MGRMTPNDAKYLNTVSLRDRAAILKIYLKNNYNQKEIAIKVFNNYEDWASMSVSSVTRSFGFHEGRGKGRYRNIPDYVIDQFVRDYDPVDYYEGLDEGTFDDYVRGYLQEIEQQRRQEEQQRLWQKQQEEEQRKRQAEYERQQKEWAAQQEKDRQRREAERKQREEAERLERERLERERQAKEAQRKAAISRGDHITLMNEAIAAVKAKDFKLARTKADKAWDIQPLVGLQYVYAFCFAAEGNKCDAIKWARDAMEGYKEGCAEYLDLCLLYLENGGVKQCVSYAQKLHEHGMLSNLKNKGIIHLAREMFLCIFRLDGGVRFMNPDFQEDELKDFMEAVCDLIVARLPKDENNRDIFLNCACVFTYLKQSEKALDIFHTYSHQENYKFNELYDIRAHMGMCYYRMGDTASALVMWFPDHLYSENPVTKPLDAVCFYGYDEAVLSVAGDNADVRNELEMAQRYLNGEICGSQYYGRFYEGYWQQHVGLEPGEDCRWFCNDEDYWELDVFTPKAKGFFARLFGR